MSRRTRALFFAAHDFRCGYCGADLLESPAAYLTRRRDHLRPRSHGGPDGEHNRVPCCATCDLLKGNAPVASIDEARQLIAERRAALLDAWQAVRQRHRDAAAQALVRLASAPVPE